MLRTVHYDVHQLGCSIKVPRCGLLTHSYSLRLKQLACIQGPHVQETDWCVRGHHRLHLFAIHIIRYLITTLAFPTVAQVTEEIVRNMLKAPIDLSYAFCAFTQTYPTFRITSWCRTLSRHQLSGRIPVGLQLFLEANRRLRTHYDTPPSLTPLNALSIIWQYHLSSMGNIMGVPFMCQFLMRDLAKHHSQTS